MPRMCPWKMISFTQSHFPCSISPDIQIGLNWIKSVPKTKQLTDEAKYLRTALLVGITMKSRLEYKSRKSWDIILVDQLVKMRTAQADDKRQDADKIEDFYTIFNCFHDRGR